MGGLLLKACRLPPPAPLLLPLPSAVRPLAAGGAGRLLLLPAHRPAMLLVLHKAPLHRAPFHKVLLRARFLRQGGRRTTARLDACSPTQRPLHTPPPSPAPASTHTRTEGREEALPHAVAWGL